MPRTPALRPRARSLGELDDRALTRRVRDDAGGALAELHRRHDAALHRYCLSLLRRPEDAADAVQDTWLRALGSLTEGKLGVSHVRGWLFAIARNACLDRLRERRRWQPTECEALDVATVDGPCDAYERREELSELFEDLDTLSERQRSALVLSEIAGLGAEEIAGTLETTPDRVAYLVSDARSALFERRAGRAMPCAEVRSELPRVRMPGRGLRAHLDRCSPCAEFHRRRRPQLLHGFLFPVPVFRVLAEKARAAMDRFGHVIGSAGDAPVAAIKPAAALCAAALAAGGGMAAHNSAPADRDPVAVAAVQVSAAASQAPVTRTASSAGSAVVLRATVRMQKPRRQAASRRPAAGATGPATAPAAPAAEDKQLGRDVVRPIVHAVTQRSAPGAARLVDEITAGVTPVVDAVVTPVVEAVKPVVAAAAAALKPAA